MKELFIVNGPHDIVISDESLSMSILSSEFIFNASLINSQPAWQGLIRQLVKHNFLSSSESSIMYSVNTPFTIARPEFRCMFGILYVESTLEFNVGDSVAGPMQLMRDMKELTVPTYE